MIEVPYDDMDFYYCLNHYDIHLKGYCIHNGEIAEYSTLDLTDYDAMQNACPSCKPGGSNEWNDCHCSTYVNVVCYVAELSFFGRMKAWLYVNVYLPLWYMCKWRLQGFSYYMNWRNR